MSMIFAILLSLTSYASMSSEPKRFYYKVRVPESALSCQQEADQLSQKFGSISKQKVVEAACKGTIELQDGNVPYRMHSIVLTYLSERELHPYTIYFGKEYMDVPGSAIGVYTTIASCLADLGGHSRTYETKTGFKVLAATCQEGTYDFEKSFVLRIDGLSVDPKIEAKLKLYAFTPSFKGSHDDHLSSEVEKLIEKAGGEATFRSKKTIFYYARYPLPVRYGYLGSFRQGNECLIQLDDARNIFTKLGAKTTIIRCLKDTNPKFPESATMEVVTDVGSDYPSYSSVQSDYYSFEECLDDKLRIMDEAFSRGYKPLGALCHKKWDNKYEMQLYKKLF